MTTPVRDGYEEQSVWARRQRALAIASLAVAAVALAVLTPLGAPFVLLALVAYAAWALLIASPELRIEAVREMPYPAEDVAAVLFDVARQPEWIEGIDAASIVGGGGARVGAIVEQRVTLPGTHERMLGRLEIVAYEPGRRLALRLLGVPSFASDEYVVESRSGGCLVRSVGVHRPNVVERLLLAWRLGARRPAFRRRRERHLEALERLVAGQRPGSSR